MQYASTVGVVRTIQNTTLVGSQPCAALEQLRNKKKMEQVPHRPEEKKEPESSRKKRSKESSTAKAKGECNTYTVRSLYVSN